MKLSFLILLCIAFLLCLTRIQAQSRIVIKGTVQDNAKNGIPYATVVAELSTKKQYFSIADNKGQFTIEVPPQNDSVLFIITAVGFIKKTERLLFDNADKTYTRNFTLAPSEKQLPEVSIKLSPAIRVSKDTVSFRADAFRQNNENNVEDLLKKIPGFSVQPDGKILFNGKPVDRILLEGDDLFNTDYATLTKNVSPSAIEYIDVLKNYKSPDDITNALKNSGEQVINLRFKKKFLRVYGNLSAGASINLKRYEIKADVVGLLAKTKFVITNNENNTGVLGSDLTAKNKLSENNENNGAKELPSPYSINGVPDLITDPHYRSRSLFNNTNSTTLNWLIKQPKIQYKISGTLFNDRYNQYENGIEQYNNSISPVIITQSQAIYKVSRYGEAKAEINYIPLKKLQLKSETDFYQANNNFSANGQLQGINSSQQYYSLGKCFRQKFIFNYLTSKNSALKLTAAYENYTLPQTLQVSPPLYDSFLLINSANYQLLQEQVSTPGNYSEAKAEWLLKIKTINFNWETGITFNHQQMISGLMLYSASDSIKAKTGTFSNNGFLKQSNVYTRISVSKAADNYSCSVFFKMQRSALSLTNLNKIPQQNNFFFFMPGAAAIINFKENRSLNLNYSLQYNLPRISDLQHGYILNDYFNFYNANTPLKSFLNQSASLFYNSFQLTSKRQLLFAGIFYNTTEAAFIKSLTIGPYYNVTTLLNLNNNNQSLIFFSQMEKFVRPLHSTLFFELSGGKLMNYSLVNQQFIRGIGNAATGSIQIRTSFDGMFNFTAAIKYTYNRQEATGNAKTIFYNQQFSSNGALHVQFNPIIALHVNIDDYAILPQTGVVQNLFLADIDFRWQVLPGKLTASIAGKNLFNQKMFTSNSITNISSSSSSFMLLNRYVLLKFNYRF